MMDFLAYLASIGLGSGRGEAYEDAVAAARVQYDRLMNGGAYGTNIAGIATGTTPTPVAIDGQQWQRLGVAPENITEGRFNMAGYDPSQHYRYDPTYGHLVRSDFANGLNTQAQAISAQDQADTGFIQKALDSGAGVFALGGLGMGAALGGAFPGFDPISGASIPAGQTGILSQLGVNNPFSDYIGGDGGADELGAHGESNLTKDAFADIYNAYAPGSTGPVPDWLQSVGATGAAGAASGGWEGEAKTGATAPSTTDISGFKNAGDWLSNLFTPGNLLNLAGNVGGALIGAGAAQKAADTQAESARESNALLRDIYNQNRADLEPWRTTGTNALARLNRLNTPGSQVSELELDPGYQFRLGEGNKNILKNASALGRIASGSTGKALQDYGQNFASNEFGNVNNRLLAMSGLGQTATNTGVQANNVYGAQAANNLTGIGNARASGYVGGANAIGGGLTNALNTYLQSEFMNKLLTRGV